MERSVGEVAADAGVTVRMLHHYDEIGLVRPRGRSSSGHRRYGDADVERLHRVLTYRALGFSLAEVAAVLDDPKADVGTHLRRQHHLVAGRIERLQRMLVAVEHALEETVTEPPPATSRPPSSKSSSSATSPSPTTGRPTRSVAPGMPSSSRSRPAGSPGTRPTTGASSWTRSGPSANGSPW